MKKHILFVAACLLSVTASAQMCATTKQECTRRGMGSAEAFPQWPKHQEKLKQIRDKKKAETDPAKLKQLANDDEDEIDRFNDKQEQACRAICENYPAE